MYRPTGEFIEGYSFSSYAIVYQDSNSFILTNLIIFLYFPDEVDIILLIQIRSDATVKSKHINAIRSYAFSFFVPTKLNHFRNLQCKLYV